MPAVALDFIQYNERMVGEDSPDYNDTLNRALKTVVSASGADEDLFVGFALRPLVAPVVGQFYVATDTDVGAAWTTLTTAMISDLTTAATGITRVGTINTGVWNGTSIATTYTDAKIKTVTGTAGRLTVGGTATDPTFDLSVSYVGQSTITTLGTIATGVWNGSVIGLAYTTAQLTSLTGTANRITLTGTATAPIVDIAAAYSGQTTIVTLGTVTTGTWNGSVITTTYTDAKVVSITGTSSRIAIGGTAGVPTVDIDSAYIGQGSITTVGTITSGTWHGTTIGTAYTDAQLVSLSGATNRTTIGGTSTNPSVDISASYVGQATITTLGTVAVGTWNATVVTTTYTEAKVKTVTGTSNRLTVGGTATDPTFDISAAYVGQATITTVGTIVTGTWAATAITVDKGGTNLTSYAVGDVLYASGATTLTRLPIGTAAQFLAVNGGATAPTWHSLVTADVTDLASATTGITKVGTVTTGVWNAGVVAGQYGGTGVNNASKTITLGGSLTTSGAFNTTITVTADTNVTFPTSGTVVTTTVTSLPSLSSVNSQTISATASFTGTMVIATGLTVSAGGVTVTGNSTITGTLGGLTGVTVTSGGVTVSAGGITVTGNSTITGTLGGLTGLTVASGGAAITGNSTVTGSMTVTSLVDLSGASAGQIKFPTTQNASTDTYTLDDYRELTWTPSIGGTASYTTRSATYIKVGKIVHLWCTLTINLIGSGNNNTITGLPVQAATGPDGVVQVFSYAGLSNDAGAHNLQGAVRAGTSQIDLVKDDGSGLNITGAGCITSGTTLQFYACYAAAA